MYSWKFAQWILYVLPTNDDILRHLCKGENILHLFGSFSGFHIASYSLINGEDRERETGTGPFFAHLCYSACLCCILIIGIRYCFAIGFVFSETKIFTE